LRGFTPGRCNPSGSHYPGGGRGTRSVSAGGGAGDEGMADTERKIFDREIKRETARERGEGGGTLVLTTMRKSSPAFEKKRSCFAPNVLISCCAARWKTSAVLSGFRVQARVSGCRVPGPGSRVQGSGFRVRGSGFRDQGSGSRVQGPGSKVQGSRSRVQGSGSRAQGSGCRVQGSRSRV